MAQKQDKQTDSTRAQLHELRLSSYELQHLRDLFSVMLPPDLKQTVSQSLALSEERSLIETNLWNKIASLCDSAGIALGDEAPDYVIAPAGPPTLGVFQLAHAQQQILQQNDSDDKEKLIFG